MLSRGERMIPVHYRDRQESPIGRCEVEATEDIEKAIIDAFEKRWVVDVDDDGGVNCRTCDGDCEHEEKIHKRLRSITEDAETDETAEGRPIPTPEG